MSPRARAATRLAAVFGMLLVAGVAPAGPLLQTAPYDVTFGDGHKYRISGKVETGGAGYIYTYTVQLLNKDIAPAHIELGIAEYATHAGLHDETNAKVLSGPGMLLYDLSPHAATPGPGNHNYVFTAQVNNSRLGIPILGGQTQVLSFEDPSGPAFAEWSLRQLTPSNLIAYSDLSSLGELPVPSLGGPIHRAPEPSTLTLAILGIAGLALRRRRKALTN